MDVPGHEFTRGRNRILKKCKLEVAGGCLCWRVESSDVRGHTGQRQNTRTSKRPLDPGFGISMKIQSKTHLSRLI